MFCKEGVLKNFANFIGKRLRWSLFFYRKTSALQSLEVCEIFKNNHFEEQLILPI